MKMSIVMRINLINLVAVLGMVFILLMASHFIKTGLMDGRIEQTRRVVEAATSIVENYEAKVKAGEMSLQDAQQTAMNTLSAMRYDKSSISG